MIEDAIAILKQGERFLVACHRRPDADALGSALGLAAILRSLGKEVLVFVPEELPPTLRFLVKSGDTERKIADTERFDATLMMDTAATNLLPPGLPESSVTGTLVVVDHHFAHDDVGDVVFRDPAASSTGEMVLRLADSLGVTKIPADAAAPLYAAIIADTGGFRYSSTKSQTLRLAADLLDAGADPWAIAYELFEGWQPAKLKLVSAVLDTLRLHFDGRLAVLKITRKMIEVCGADDNMGEGLVNYARHIRGAEVGALLWEWPVEGEPCRIDTKISLRSRGRVDVSKVAVIFGGGGHQGAAAAQVSTSIEETTARVVDEVSKLLP